jgi:hypothetical protein
MSDQNQHRSNSQEGSASSRREQDPSFRNVDVKALGRMLHWSIELLDRQRGMILSALEVVEGRQPPGESGS